MSEFTKGPWYITDENWDGEGYSAADDIAIILDANNKEVLGTSEWIRVEKPDLVLMTAAPDMYEALDTQCAYCVGKEATNCPCEECIVGKALRKARGEPVSDAHKLEED